MSKWSPNSASRDRTLVWELVSMALRRGTGSWALTYGASTKMAVEKGSLDLPRKPGVYLFRNNDGRVMYWLLYTSDAADDA